MIYSPNLDKERLKKLIRLLSSNKEGEVLAAVNAIERHLKSNDLSFHELADTITDKIIETVRVKVVEKVIEVEVDRSKKDWIEATDKLIATGALSPRELEFVQSMRRSFQLSANFEPSDKQTNWFVMLYKRHVR